MQMVKENSAVYKTSSSEEFQLGDGIVLTGNAVEQDVQAVADKFGITADRIKVFRPNWRKLMQSGVVMTVHIGYSRLQTRLSLSDFGMGQTDEENQGQKAMKKLYRMGTKMLAPKHLLNRLHRIERRARDTIERYSVMAILNGRFVPYTAFAELNQILQECETEFWQIIDLMTADETVEGFAGSYSYQEMQREIAQAYRFVAGSLYGRLRTNHPHLLERTDGSVIEVEDFCDSYVAEILSRIPSPKEIQERAYFHVEMSYLPLPDLLAKEQALADIVEAKASTITHREAEARRTETMRHDTQRQALVADLRARQSAADHREQMLRQMNQEVLAKARQQAEAQIDRFLKQIQVRVYNLVYGVASDVLAYIRNKGQMHPRKAVQLSHMLAELERLNFYGDETIEAVIGQVGSHLALSAGERPLGELDGILSDVALVSGHVLLSLDESPERSMRDLGLPDEPLVVEVTEAMSRLTREVAEPVQMTLEPVVRVERPLADTP